MGLLTSSPAKRWDYLNSFLLATHMLFYIKILCLNYSSGWPNLLVMKVSSESLEVRTATSGKTCLGFFLGVQTSVILLKRQGTHSTLNRCLPSICLCLLNLLKVSYKLQKDYISIHYVWEVKSFLVCRYYSSSSLKVSKTMLFIHLSSFVLLVKHL